LFRIRAGDVKLVRRTEDIESSGGESQLLAAFINGDRTTPAVNRVRE
jgi:hypothetical protein